MRQIASTIACCMLWLVIAVDAAAAANFRHVTFQADGAELAAHLYLPGKSNRAPAVILIPGSQESRNLPGLAEHLVSKGIAVLSLHKRGIDGSDGTWKTETIEQRAGDVLAALRYLKGVGAIDSNRIGLVGHSQGGWVAQFAAAKSRDVNFLVLLAGPAQTVREQILIDEQIHLTRWGIPAAEVQERIERLDQMLTASLTNPAVCGDRPQHYLCGLIRFDPTEAIRNIRVPVLALYGERDPMTPPKPNAELLLAKLPESTRPLVTSRVFPEANHVFWKSKTGLRDESGRLKHRYVPGFLETISGWIEKVAAR
ncbi:MAG TPA: alpha/beta fold hydrolase [Sphingomicrobium sp.]|nr:alpha/beta fold hydrolase [Sphingomicrobium sp.]